MSNKKELSNKKIRPSIMRMVKDGMSTFSIAAAHGFIVTPDEAEYLKSSTKTK